LGKTFAAPEASNLSASLKNFFYLEIKKEAFTIANKSLRASANFFSSSSSLAFSA